MSVADVYQAFYGKSCDRMAIEKNILPMVIVMELLA